MGKMVLNISDSPRIKGIPRPWIGRFFKEQRMQLTRWKS